MQSKIMAIDKLKILPEEKLVEQVLEMKHQFKGEVKNIIGYSEFKDPQSKAYIAQV